ncbi:MAG: bifunctional tRNA (5-methylaminomethyl-2-thiouridine)(34)-methyltransferase MnmD/FAD-dependent 5-carboxymethylaminomethyl-2-thiouridine(34) oxidoreductase MnmC [Parvularculaceae bacterium]|nr:MAG: bifunctional tRNA (5-methylaminomethyl-2-thiouridine)(34)-methyltransferase MnmD/FAD-dependent 5-carboxymethylaminomethyl-2-thiouridine(34) oxidoreductase MnmC [Parvularculaceae bacterium]
MSKNTTPAHNNATHDLASQNPVSAADIDWDRDANAPRSRRFDDIYFAQDGPAESRHVFLNGNDLTDRWRSSTEFTIGETGFGTGLNFLTAWDLWNQTAKPNGARLNFISCEQYPLTPADLATAHKAWPDLHPLATQLQTAYPPVSQGFHQLNLSTDVCLTLIFDEAAAAFSAMHAKIDAWFLDGFAPSKNPEMWRAQVLERIAEKSAPGATIATFTVAGAVRRGLTQVGFSLSRRPGFGRKREMLTGRIDEPAARTPIQKPWFSPAGIMPRPKGAHIAIIGAGIAGASAAYALKRHGLRPVIFDKQGPAAGASGNPGGLIMPRLDLGETPQARFFRQAYTHALNTLEEIGAARNGFFHPCGVLLKAENEEERHRQHKISAAHLLPDDFITADEAGLFFPHAGIVDPRAYVAALIGDVPVHQSTISTISSHNDLVTLQTENGTQEFSAVIIANGRDALQFLPARSLPLSGVAGQIDWIDETPAPQHAIAAGPYIAPLPGTPDRGVLFGATYDKISPGDAPTRSSASSETNLTAARKLYPELPSCPTSSRVSVRCQTPDRLPIVGAAPCWQHFATAYDDLRFGKTRNYQIANYQPGIFLLTGLGSRGLVTAPLCAAIIAQHLTGGPAPTSLDILHALHPGRFFIRDMKRAGAKSPSY